MAKKNSLPQKNTNCLNCGFPFQGHEIFCPECGQKNKLPKITLSNFLNEVFKGFTSWDAKFWKTIVPLLIKPGKVTEDYIKGKRANYVNPFRFYIIVSVIFFLLIGVYNKLQEIRSLKKESIVVKKKKKQEFNQQIDSIKGNLDNTLDNIPFVRIDSTAREKMLKDVVKDAKNINNNKSNINFTLLKGSLIDKFMIFERKHKSLSIDEALDGLRCEKTNLNRFLYNRAKTINNIVREEDGLENFFKDNISNVSVSLFVLLPIFTLFLKLLYIRRRFTYVEHLLFVFHIQTVFFIILILFLLLSIIDLNVNLRFFLLLFLIYLFIAMKRFYNQGYLKMTVKYLMINFVYFILAILGVVGLTFVSLTLY